MMADVRDYACADTLRNGLAVTIRTQRPDDRERIAAAFRQLDRESIYMRLFRYKDDLTERDLDRVMQTDPEREVALLVTTGTGPEEIVIGSARYIALDPQGAGRRAEVAFMVEEDYQGLGIAGRLLKHLAGIARERGFAAFEADVLAANASMLKVFARSGLPMTQRREGGVVHVTLALGSGQA